MGSLELTYECPSCHAVGSVNGVEAIPGVTCRACGQAHELCPEACDESGLRCCVWCGTEDLYIQKDFPQGLGLLIVVAGFAISTVFWYYEMPLSAENGEELYRMPTLEGRFLEWLAKQ